MNLSVTFTLTIEPRLLKHPNIVSLLGVTASAEEIVLILNFISGNNLDMLIFGKAKLLSTVCRNNTSINYVAVYWP